MLEHGYAGATVNRHLSSIGSVYRWAKQKRLSPRGFKSPTLGAKRFEERIRRVHVEHDDLERLRVAALGFSDPGLAFSYRCLSIPARANQSCWSVAGESSILGLVKSLLP
jgi:hypothetical protein